MLRTIIGALIFGAMLIFGVLHFIGTENNGGQLAIIAQRGGNIPVQGQGPSDPSLAPPPYYANSNSAPQQNAPGPMPGSPPPQGAPDVVYAEPEPIGDDTGWFDEEPGTPDVVPQGITPGPQSRMGSGGPSGPPGGFPDEDLILDPTPKWDDEDAGGWGN